MEGFHAQDNRPVLSNVHNTETRKRAERTDWSNRRVRGQKSLRGAE